MFHDPKEFAETLSAAERDALRYLAFVIVRPDAVVRGFERAVVERFSAEKLDAVAFRFGEVDERQMEELYRFTQFRMMRNQMRPLWWLTRDMYRTAPALLLLLAGKHPDAFSSTAAFVNDLKGPPNPFLTRPGQIRHQCRAMNAVLCIIHSSDDADETLRESLIFFTPEEVRTALFHTARTIAGETPSAHRLLEKSVAHWYGKTRQPGSFVSVLATVKLRILAHLSLFEELAGSLDVIGELCAETIEIAGRGLPYAEEWEAVSGLFQRELEILERIEAPRVVVGEKGRPPSPAEQARVDRAGLLEVLQTFADSSQFEFVSFTRTRDILRRNGVVLDPWESLVLESSFVFHNRQLEGYRVPQTDDPVEE